MKIIKAVGGEEVIVDDDIYLVLIRHRITIDEKGYPIITSLKSSKVHKFVFGDSGKQVIDHANRNPLDNRRENLRIASRAENSYNRNKTNKEKSSKYKGVTYSKRHKSGNVWFMTCKTNKKVVFQGMFDSEIAAANAYNYYAKLHQGEFAALNDVPYMEKKQWESYLRKNTSKYNGVSYRKKTNNWEMQIWDANNKKPIRVYGFKTEIEAALEYNKKGIELYGENFKKFNHIEK